MNYNFGQWGEEYYPERQQQPSRQKAPVRQQASRRRPPARRRRPSPQISPQAQKIATFVGAGFTLSQLAALGLSYAKNRSILWALLHGAFGPAYLIYVWAGGGGKNRNRS